MTPLLWSISFHSSSVCEFAAPYSLSVSSVGSAKVRAANCTALGTCSIAAERLFDPCLPAGVLFWQDTARLFSEQRNGRTPRPRADSNEGKVRRSVSL